MQKESVALFLITLFLAASSLAQGTVIYSNDYTSDLGWIQVGKLVEITNGRVEFQNDCPDGMQRRVYTFMETTLNSEGVDHWCLDLDFYFQGVSLGFGSGHMLVGLTAGTQEPNNNCPDIPCSGDPVGTQDAIGVVLRTTTPTSSDRKFVIRVREGSASLEFDSPGIPLPGKNTSYFLHLEQIESGQLELSVFSDDERTIHLPGSPVRLTFTPTITGLSVVQHANAARGAATRYFNGYVDNLNIYSCGEVRGGKDREQPKPGWVYPNPSTGIFHILANDISKTWITVYDPVGKRVMSLPRGVEEIDLSGFPNGVYFCQILGEVTQYVRLVKQD